MSTVLNRTRPLPAPPRVISRPGPRVVRVALAGCGTVGGSLIRLLRDHGPAIEREHGLRFQIVSVLVRDIRRPRIVESAASALTADPAALLASNAEIVVEATGAPELALALARATLTRGRCFVTANKALLAQHGEELAARAREHGGRLHFEAAVGGGVPVIRALRESLRHTGVRAVRGVLNGTSNYVLTRMNAGESLDQALHDARLRGFAEADASRDLDGRDAADKIAILAWLAFGINPAAVQVQRRGLLPDAGVLVAAARVHGGVLRQQAECFRTADGQVCALVEPVIVAHSSPLAHAEGEENCVVVETHDNGRVRLFGPGAGGPPTASALLADMLQAGSDEPGARTDAPAPAADPRLHAWALSLPAGGTALLLRTATETGLTLESVHTDAASATLQVCTAPATRTQVQALLAQLEAAGTSAVAVRMETAAA